MSGNCSQDEGQFSGDDSSRIGNGTPVDPLQTVDTRYRNIALIIPKNNSPLTYFLFSPRGFSFFLRTARTIGGRKKGEKNSREISRSIIPHTFPRSRAGKSRRRVRGRERKCINAARNVRDDEVAVYTLYRMHEIFGSRESPLLRRGKVYESPWKLTFFMDRRRRGGEGRGNRDISARSHGLHRVKLGRSFGKKAAPSFRAGRRIDRGKEMIRFFCHDDPFFSGGNALSPRGGYFIRRGKCKSVEVVILKGIRRSVFCREAAKIS